MVGAVLQVGPVPTALRGRIRRSAHFSLHEAVARGCLVAALGVGHALALGRVASGIQTTRLFFRGHLGVQPRTGLVAVVVVVQAIPVQARFIRVVVVVVQVAQLA